MIKLHVTKIQDNLLSELPSEAQSQSQLTQLLREVSELDLRLALITQARDQGVINFREAVYLLTAEIPRGNVLGYGQVASLLGSPRAARQVGFALGALSPERALPDREETVPWWRVLRTSGHIALRGDPLRPQYQQSLLEAEGVVVIDHRVDMKIYQWPIL